MDNQLQQLMQQLGPTFQQNGMDQQEFFAFMQSPEGKAADEQVRKEFQIWRKKQYGLVDNTDIASLSQRLDQQDEQNALLQSKLDMLINEFQPRKGGE